MTDDGDDDVTQPLKAMRPAAPFGERITLLELERIRWLRNERELEALLIAFRRHLADCRCSETAP